MRDSSTIQDHLCQLGLSKDEALIFMKLLGGPKTQLGLSRSTGIARSNVYRIVDSMIDKGLVCERTTENGKTLTSATPDVLEALVIEQEVAAQTRRASLDELLPMLGIFQEQHDDFAIKTYSGLGGLKQMLWNELKSSGEILLFSGGRVDSATSKHWAEKYRQEVGERGLIVRSLQNHPFQTPSLPYPETYTKHYRARYVPVDVLNIKLEMSICGNTISIYNSLAHNVQLGTEITNPFLALFMRQMFDHYWNLATPEWNGDLRTGSDSALPVS